MSIIDIFAEKYYQGHMKAFSHVWNATAEELLDQIDALGGRALLPENPTYDHLRWEAMRQTRIDWLNSQHEFYSQSLSNLENMAWGEK